MATGAKEGKSASVPSRQGASSLLSGLKSELALRSFFGSSLQVELNEKLAAVDTLSLKRTVFLSGITLFNFSLFSLYAAFKVITSRRVPSKLLVVPVLLGLFTMGVYKIGLQWLNREFLRAIENSEDDCAYFLRSTLVDQLERGNEMADIVGPRLALLKRKNEEYEQLYGVSEWREPE